MLDQNVRVVVALRAAIPADAPRIVVLDPKLNTFVDLPAGVTAEQIALGWRDFAEFDENEQVGLAQAVSAGAGGHDPSSVGTEGPARQPFEARDAWVVPPWAPRPQVGPAYQLDLAQHPEAVAAPEPGARYEVSLPGGLEADYYTDPAGQLRYVETVAGNTTVPNPVLDVPQPDATYVVHPVDARYAVVLRTDLQGRVVQVAADPLGPAWTYGLDAHPFAALLGAWPGRVSPHAVVPLGGSAEDGLAALARRLIDTMNHGRHVAVRVQVSYADISAVPSQFQVDWVADGQSGSELFLNT
ncbi:MAG: hypothetical protein FWH11_09815 [Micrococcales bacterium]|nr:hypothetical protein [Micrococcales bacterium]